MVWTAPSECPVGHSLLVRVKRGWTQCGCGLAHRPPHNPAGHDYVMCLTVVDGQECKREIREGGCERLADGYPVPEPREPWAAI